MRGAGACPVGGGVTSNQNGLRWRPHGPVRRASNGPRIRAMARRTADPYPHPGAVRQDRGADLWARHVNVPGGLMDPSPQSACREPTVIDSDIPGRPGQRADHGNRH